MYQDRYDLLDKLEGRYIFVNDQWRRVRNCRHSTEYGIEVNLLYQETAILEMYLENSKVDLDE